MLVFHGSSVVVEHPDLARCRAHNDYGVAFYCAFNRELAMEWACEDVATDGYVTEYEVDLSELNVLDLDEDPRGVMAWISVLLANRRIDREWNASQDIARFLAAYPVDLGTHDAVAGYRADDSYFSIARAFVGGTITDEQLADALKLGELGRQIAFRTERAMASLQFAGAHPVDASVWGARRHARDRKARQAFARLKRQPAASGRRIFELGRG